MWFFENLQAQATPARDTIVRDVVESWVFVARIVAEPPVNISFGRVWACLEENTALIPTNT